MSNKDITEDKDYKTQTMVVNKMTLLRKNSKWGLI